MIELLAMSSPNVQKVHIMLEETGLPYRVKRVDVWKGENYTPEFEALNPVRKVPILIDDDGPGGQPCTVFESGAILIYLAEKSGMFLPAAGAARYQVLQWLMVQMAGIGPMFGQYTHFRVFAPKGNEYSENRYRTQAVRFFEALDRRLSETAYIGGEDYSIADMATYPWTRDRASKWGGDWDGYANVRRWFDQVSERPAVRRMKAEMDQIWQTDLVSIGEASVDITDRFLGRGKFDREPNR